MKVIVTEEMRFRLRVVKYAIKHNNNAKAARRYHTSRQQVQKWRKNMMEQCDPWQINQLEHEVIQISTHRMN